MLLWLQGVCKFFRGKRRKVKRGGWSMRIECKRNEAGEIVFNCSKPYLTPPEYYLEHH